MNFRELVIGNKYYRWTVLGELGTLVGFGSNCWWWCVCDCGTKSMVRGTDLVKGFSKSCGCWRSESTATRFAKRTGSKNPMYKTGTRIGVGKKHQEFKEVIRRRDGYKCVGCTITQEEIGQKLDVHHINGVYNDDRPENALTFCRPCHQICNNHLPQSINNK